MLGESSGLTEPGVARDVMAALPEGSSLVLSSSMPVRDVEWFAAPRAGVDVYSNRGANGIDGVVSTAVGVALATRRPTTVLIGDVAVLHDTNGMLMASSRDIDLTIVVVDNDGGGIFSFLPQATSLPPDTFERLFGTPHGVDLIALAAVHGIPEVTSLAKEMACGWCGCPRSGRPTSPSTTGSIERWSKRWAEPSTTSGAQRTTATRTQGRRSAPSIAASFACVSASSASTSDSRTTPTPA